MYNAFDFIKFNVINNNIEMQNFKRFDNFNCKSAIYHFMHFVDRARFTVDDF